MPRSKSRTARAEVRQRRNGVPDETAVFAKCIAVAEDYMMSYAAYNYTAREVVECAAEEYGAVEWRELGIVLNDQEPGYDRERAGRFLKYMYKAVYGWRRTDMRSDGSRHRKLELLEKNKAERNKVIGLWIGNPEAQQLELQRVVMRNRRRDDKTVVSAIRAAAEIDAGTSGVGDAVVDAVRTIRDVPPDKRSQFITHMPKPKQ
jgi:hypothetical protein